MKDNSKSGLKIKQFITILPTLIILTLCIQFFILNKNNSEQQVAELNVEESSTEVAEVTSRSAEERKLEEVQEKQEEIVEENNYISIDEITISRDMDLTQRCGVSKEDFMTLMADLSVDSSGFFEENSGIIYDLCEEYEINEIFFCGLIGAESGFNIASNHRNKNNYISMMSNGSMIRYASPEEGLEAAAKLLHNKYLTPGGSCYFGKTLSCVQRRFCPNSSTWVGLVYGCMSKIIK